MTGAPFQLSSDRPLVDPAEDRLGYAPFAKHLARGVLRGCPADGLVVGLYGAWGTGKSTALNFILHHLDADPEGESPIIVRFNPWWFAGQEDLVRRFFAQFEAAIFRAQSKKRKLFKKMTAFSSALSELPHGVGTAAKAVRAAMEAASTTDIVELKAEFVAQLAREAMRIVVVIDDIDRLAASEIRTLFQVVKAVADFPNVIYLLSFDRDVVVTALESSNGTDGNEYLEKIVQVPFTLPPPERLQLQTLFSERLSPLLSGTPPALFDRQHWGNIFLEGIEPFITKPRDVVRLLNALTVTYPAVIGEVNAVDFIALEALRVFAPAAYDVIRNNADMFTGGAGGIAAMGDPKEQRRFHETWLGQLKAKADVVKDLVSRLFPHLASVLGSTTYSSSSRAKWRKSLRVCSPELFPVYFRFTVAPGDVPASTVRDAVAEAGDGRRLGERLLALSRETRPDGHTRATSLLTRLRDHAEVDIPDAAVGNFIFTLCDVGDQVARAGKRTSPLDLGDEYRIGGLLRVMIARLAPGDREAALASAFANAGGLVTIITELVSLGAEHGRWGRDAKPDADLVTDVVVDRLQKIVLGRIRLAGKDGSLWSSSSPAALLDAWSMFGDDAGMRKAVLAHTHDDAALLAFMRPLVTHVHGHGMTDRVSRVSLAFDPQRLSAFTDVDLVAERVEAMDVGKMSEADRDLIDAFKRGRRARALGKDPRAWDPGDDAS